jgi:cation diffusion facilitator family transporter
MPASSKKALIGAVVANVGIAITKLAVGAVTGSTVMIAEGIHSLVDSGNSGLMMFGRWRSRQPPDAEHPFGYGMELYFWSFVVAMLVFGGGGGLSIYEGVHALSHPREPTSLWLSYLVIGVSALFEGASLVIAFREFAIYRRERRDTGSVLSAIRASKNPAIFLTVLEDSAAMVGLVIAALGLLLRQLTGWPGFDAGASIIIGLVLMVEAMILAVECRGLIVGESARPIVIERVRRAVTHHAGDLGVVHIRTLQLGPESILVLLELTLPPGYDLFRLPPAVNCLTDELRRAIPAIRYVSFALRGDREPGEATTSELMGAVS